MKIIVDNELCTRIEMLQYEVNSRKEIITTYLQTNTNKTDLFEAYQKEYTEYFTEYNKAKQELVKTYNVPNNSKWNLNFATRELTY